VGIANAPVNVAVAFTPGVGGLNDLLVTVGMGVNVSVGRGVGVHVGVGVGVSVGADVDVKVRISDGAGVADGVTDGVTVGGTGVGTGVNVCVGIAVDTGMVGANVGATTPDTESALTKNPTRNAAVAAPSNRSTTFNLRVISLSSFCGYPRCISKLTFERIDYTWGTPLLSSIFNHR